MIAPTGADDPMLTVGWNEMEPTTANFFDESSEQSQVKTAIVAKYFEAWARVMIGAQNKSPQHKGRRIAYIDLFTGRLAGIRTERPPRLCWFLRRQSRTRICASAS